MISGAAQADVAILVISARKGEFEAGFDKGGQTREHIVLVKTAGVSRLVIAINKMDEPTVQWDKARFVFFSFLQCSDSTDPVLNAMTISFVDTTKLLAN